jgi:peroxiredoxin Q/BCP
MGRKPLVPLPKHLRVIATSAAAIATGLFNTVRARNDAPRVVLAPGDVAPDFSLAASDGCTYRLSDFRGRQTVVLAWFPKAFTGGCMAECESIGASGEGLQYFDAAYFAASVDAPETNRQFARAMGVTYPILSDPDKSVARAYGVLGASGFPLRRTFYIGIDGRVLAVDADVKVRTHGLEIEKMLTALHVPRRHS